MQQGPPTSPYNPQAPPPPGAYPQQPQQQQPQYAQPQYAQPQYAQPQYAQPPPGYGAPVVPPKSGPSAGMIVAIVVIVVVGLVVGVPALLYFSVTSGPGVSTGPGPVHPTMSLSVGNWQGLSTVAVITSISSSVVPVSGLTYQVVAGNGTIYFNGNAGTGSAVHGVVMTITYNDASSDGLVGPDDNIAISVAQASDLAQIHGTTFRVLQGLDVVGSSILP